MPLMRIARLPQRASVLVLVRGMGLVNSFALTLIERPMAFNQDLKALIPHTAEVSGAFLMYALTFGGPRMLQKISAAAHGTKRLSQDDLQDFKFLLPPLSEQVLIAEVLDRCQMAIEIESRARAKTLEIKKAAMRELFTRGLRGEAQKQSDVGLIPESWSVLTLQQVASFERGRFLHRPRNEPRFYGGSTPFIQTGDVVRSGGRIREYRQTLNSEGVAISRVVAKSTILITIAANIGYTGILEFDAACPDSLVAIQAGPDLDSCFLEFYLRTQQPEMDRLAPKGTQKNINIQFLNPWPVVIPAFAEQQEIVGILSAIDKKIEIHKKKHAILDNLFKSLLHKLMTGEIRASDLDRSALDAVHPTEVTA